MVESLIHELRQFALFLLRQHRFRIQLCFIALRRGILRHLHCSLEFIRFKGPLTNGSIDTNTDQRRAYQKEACYLFEMAGECMVKFASLDEQSGAYIV